MKKIVSIKSLGISKVYDVSVNHDSHNFILENGVVAHNCTTQPALRGFMDEFSKNAIFILTCNFKSRLINPLISRLQVVEFKFNKEEKQLAAKAMLVRCCSILDQEKVTYDRKSVAGLVAKNFPDFRKTLVQLQRYSTSGNIDSGIVVEGDDSNISELVSYIKSKDFTKCRQWVANNAMDSSLFYRSLYDKLLVDLVPQTVPQTILIIAQSQFQAASSVDQEINQMAALIQIMQSAAFK